jgi:phosphatidylethanolamine/phosphatidyl-N-methylethanolamine N-methyltransferase
VSGTFLVGAPEPRRRRAAVRQEQPARSGHLLFLREFVRAPLRTASVVPSSRSLAEQMVRPLLDRDWSHRSPVVLELGPGTGAFTRVIQETAPKGTRHLGIELSPVMARHLSSSFPQVEVVIGAAADLPQILDRCDVDGVDLIISGLPWQSFAGPAGPRLIDTIAGCLAPGGTYNQFTYSWTRWAPPAKKQHRALRDSFDDVQVSRTIWRNFPPAFVYTSTRPTPSGS